MQSQSSNLSFRDLVESILRQGLNQSKSCFIPEPYEVQTRHDRSLEPPLRTEINQKVIEEFLKP